MSIGRRHAAPLAFAALIGCAIPNAGLNAAPPTPARFCVNNKCSAPPPATAAVAGPAVTTGIKWHPGHYVWLDPHSTPAAQFAAIDALSAETSVQGIELLINWSSLEGDTQGDYSAGFAAIDAYLAKLGSLKVPKRLLLGLNERSFGTPPPAGTNCATAGSSLLPAYLATLADGGCAVAAPGAAGSLAVMARFWEQPVMDRLIALSQAYAQRYDQNPLFEMFWGNGETAVAAPANSGFTQAAYNAQLKRWYDASKKVWQHTQLRLASNYDGSDAQTLDLITYATTGGGVIVGGPDPELPLPVVTRTVQANDVFRGATGGGSDLRSTIPWIGEVQGMGLGVKFTQTPTQIFSYQSGTMNASYMVWMQNTYLGSAPQQWSTGILPYIQSIQGSVSASACPPIYQQRCVTN
jgi:hypothetical protein